MDAVRSRRTLRLSFRLIRDAGRPPEDLLAEGIALSKTAERLIEPQ